MGHIMLVAQLINNNIVLNTPNNNPNNENNESTNAANTTNVNNNSNNNNANSINDTNKVIIEYSKNQEWQTFLTGPFQKACEIINRIGNVNVNINEDLQTERRNLKTVEQIKQKAILHHLESCEVNLKQKKTNPDGTNIFKSEN